MAVVVEDGSVVAGANSYLSIVECTSLLEGLGFSTTAATATEGQLRSAAQYIDSYRAQFKGSKYSSSQAMQWPRIDVEIDGFSVDYDEIPTEVKTAQALAAAEIIAGNSLWNTNTSGKSTISTSVDVISVTYSDSGAANSSPRFGRIEAVMEPLLKTTGLSVTRV